MRCALDEVCQDSDSEDCSPRNAACKNESAVPGDVQASSAGGGKIWSSIIVN